VQFRILGPVQLLGDDGRVITPARRRERCLLAVLLLEPNHVVPAHRLTDLLWEDQPSEHARRALYAHVARLRAVLADAGADRCGVALVSHGEGYLLRVEPDMIDAYQFRGLVEQATTTPDLSRREEQLRTALAMWRGAALHNAATDRLRERLCADLEELRLHATEESMATGIALGRHPGLVAELARLVEQHPTRERLVELLMLALYRCGRQSDALAVYADVRRKLVDELGIEPNPGLRLLQQRILREDPALAPPDTPVPDTAVRRVPAIRQLPRDVPDFIGRTTEIKELDAMLADAGGAAAVVITAIAGTAGVGKTALAVHWGRRIAGRYPEGQLYVNLRGYDPERPLRPVEALAALLRNLGMPAEQIPVDVDHAGAMYRSLLDGKRFLVLLDNARSVDQVRPLLPASPGCLTLITSRDRLTGLVAADGARRLSLDVLSTDDALDLLRRIIGAARVADEPQAALALTELCCGLPLALRIAAANLLDDPIRRIADHIRQLRDGDRLTALAVEDDPQSAVLAAFGWSYRSLPVPARRMFRLLAVAPGPDVTAAAMGAAAGVPPAEAARTLNSLANANLVTEHLDGRYAAHDLLRSFARRLHEIEDAADLTAAARLYEYYLSHVDAAARLLYPNMLRLEVPAADVTFVDGAAALNWLDTERHCLVAAILQGTARGQDSPAWLIADAMRGYFWLRRHNVDWLAVAGAALDAAHLRGDTRAKTSAHLSFATAYGYLGRFDDAIAHYRDALNLYEETGWIEGQAAALNNLGIVGFESGQLQLAAEYYERAVAIYRQLDRPEAMVSSLNNLGVVHLRAGALAAASTTLCEASILAKESGTPVGYAAALHNLGIAYQQQGRCKLALECLTEGRRRYAEAGSVDGEAMATASIAELDRDAGRLGEALDQARTALDVLQKVGERKSEALALTVLGTILQMLGQCEEAARQHRRALDLARELNSRHPEVEALLGLAATEQLPTGADRALDHAGRALRIATEMGYRVLQAQALTTMAEINATLSALPEAARLAAEAVDIQRDTGCRQGEARALLALASCLDDPDAAHHRSTAKDVLTEIWLE